MFSGLSERLTKTVKNLTGQGRLTEKNIQETMREVRMALLEADVALPVVKAFVHELEEKAIGQDVMKSLTPGQALIKIVRDELTQIMGATAEPLSFKCQPPAVILMAGLQGSGKTTTAGKLAKRLQEKDKKKVMLTSCDVYRPAAIKQLEMLAQQVNADYFPSTADDNPVQIANNALQQAKKQGCDILIVDTAGRLHVDQEMMNEIKAIHQQVNPIETLFVVDSMTGQDAANTAKAFHDALALTGVVLTKTDGDARGGAALSIRHITGQPIKFMGVGEKIDALEVFHPDRVTSRILGMGDVLGLIEQAEQSIDKEKAKQTVQKLKKGGFDLEDFRDQLLQMQNMGGISSLMEKMPGMPAMPKGVAPEKEVGKIKAMIDSMTVHERRRPDIIKGSRKKRITQGSGTTVQDLNKLLKQFTQMQKMMKKMTKKGGMRKMMQSMQAMMGAAGKGGMPPF